MPARPTLALAGATAGAMAFAQAALAAGFAVLIWDDDPFARARAGENAARLLPADARARLAFCADPAALAPAAIGIDATDEGPGQAQAALRTLERHLPPDAPLATTAAFALAQIAPGLANPARLSGLRLHLAGRLLEIQRATETAQPAFDAICAFGRALGCQTVAGILSERLLLRYHEAADTLVMDGSTPWEVDDAMVAFGMALGPYEAQDISGLDLTHAARLRHDAARPPKRRAIPLTERMVHEGRLGRKVGVGWYRYPGGGGKVIDPLVEDLAREEAWFAGTPLRQIPEGEIVERLLLALINESAHLLGAASAAQIDLVAVLALGFPPALGGALQLAARLGPAAIVARLDDWAETDPEAWTPAPALRRAARGEGVLIPPS